MASVRIPEVSGRPTYGSRGRALDVVLLFSFIKKRRKN